MNADIPIVSVLLRAVLLVISVLAVGFCRCRDRFPGDGQMGYKQPRK